MWKKLGRLIINNFGLKVLAVVLAIVLWLAIVNVADPDKVATFTVPVEIVNAEYLEDEGKTYEVLDNTDYISFTVTGPRSIVETLTENDFRAIANMSNIDDSMSMVPIILTPTAYSSQLEITNRETYLLVSVENLVTSEFGINIEVSGSPVRNCFVDEVEVSPGVVSVTGPESLVDEISYAEIIVDVSGADESFTSTEPIYLMNENDNTVEDESLTSDITEADVTVTVIEEKEVPISFVVTGIPEEGYWYTDPEYDVTSILIQGDPDVIDEIDSLSFSAPSLNVDGVSSDVSVTVRLADSLPEGVALGEDQDDGVTVTVPIVEADQEEIEIPAERITVENAPADMRVTVASDPVTVVLEGLEDNLDDVDGSLLAGTIDASDLTSAGSYIVTVDFETDGTYRAIASVPVSVERISTSGD